MKTIRLVTMAVLAVVTTGAVGAASASAFEPPELGRCVKVAAGTGNFTSATCVKKELAGKFGSYEWNPGAAKPKFTTTGGVGTLTALSGVTVVCKTEASGGEFNTPQTVTGVTVRFTGCESAGFKCATAGAKEGEIVTNPLEGRLGIINKGKKQIGEGLFPTAADGGLYVTFNCGVALHITVGGSVINPITPIDKMIGPGLTVTHETLKYKATAGKQIPEKFETGLTDILITEINGKKPEQSGITITSSLFPEEDGEVNFFF